MDRSAAAKKAWVTIRKNKRKRSLAAVKANETRGEKGRSLAAKRAWATRKANANRA